MFPITFKSIIYSLFLNHILNLSINFVILNFLFSSIIFSQDISNTLGIIFEQIPPGSFQLEEMDSFDRGSGNTPFCPNNKCIISMTSFMISKTPISRHQWEQIMKKEYFSPWEVKKEKECPDCPADGMDYSMVQLFLEKLSLKDSKDIHLYTLPTEAEFIYAFGNCSDPCSNLYKKTSYDELTKEINAKPNFISANAITRDFYWDKYIDYFSKNNIKSPMTHPFVNKPYPRFEYGKTSIEAKYDSNRIQFYRRGQSINIPMEKINIYLVKRNAH